MKKFNIFITSHSLKYIKNYIDFKKNLENSFPETRLFVIFSTDEPNEVGLQIEDFYFLNSDYSISKKNEYNDKNIIRQKLDKFSKKVPSDLYQCDLRGTIGVRTLKMLAAEQAIILDKTEKIFKTINPDLVFVSSGTNILHSTLYFLSNSFGAKTYRVHSFLQGNINFSGFRVWFCSNNKMQLSDKPEDNFNYDTEELNQRIKDLHFSLKERLFKPDIISKKFQARRMPLNPKDFLKDLAELIILSLSPNLMNRLKANLYLDRIKILLNSTKNRFIETKINDIKNPSFLFALNTPYDSQILVRAPEYKDFISVIKLIAGMMPYGYDLVLREHPAFQGMLDNRELKSLMKKYPFVKLLSSQTSLPEAIKAAESVIIFNNTAFVDTILANKPVISLANGYFKGHNVTNEIINLRDLRETFQKVINRDFVEDKSEKLKDLMCRQFNETYPDPKTDNSEIGKIETINQGIEQKLKRIIEVYGSLENFSQKLKC